MKIKVMKKSKQLQGGFAMLEVMLAILIIAIASFGIYKLYSSSSVRTGVSTTGNIVNQVSSAVSQYVNNYMASPSTLSQLVDVGYLSKDVVDVDKETGDTINTPLGSATFASQPGSGYNAYTITFSSVPEASLMSFVKDMSALSDVHVGGTYFHEDGSNASSIIESAQAKNVVELNFPKGTKTT